MSLSEGINLFFVVLVGISSFGQFIIARHSTRQTLFSYRLQLLEEWRAIDLSDDTPTESVHYAIAQVLLQKMGPISRVFSSQLDEQKEFKTLAFVLTLVEESESDESIARQLEVMRRNRDRISFYMESELELREPFQILDTIWNTLPSYKKSPAKSDFNS
ncbi:MAG: hypothetical protein JJ956_16550 [Pseudomonadales bacterium]|nr:hypothetical protein [Pseudomonadales bacterium]